MGILDGILGSGLTALAGIGQQIAQNAYNRKEAEKNREFQSAEAEENRIFQSNEAALQRDWSAAEAERARDWQEEMYEKYNSLSGKIAQAEAAGVNPMFAITGGAVTPAPTSASSPSGASAGSVGTPSGSQAASSFVDIVGQVLGFQKLKSQINVDNALAEKYRSEAENTGWLSKLNEREYNIITEHNFDIQMLESQIGLTNEQAVLVYQQAGEVFERAGKIAAEKDFLVDTADDRAKIFEYERLMAEFEKGLPASIDALSKGESMSLNEAVGAILKSILLIRNK